MRRAVDPMSGGAQLDQTLAPARKLTSTLVSAANTASASAAVGPVSPTAIEYVTRDLFAKKSLRAASKAFFMKFSGQDNIFLGRVDYSIEQIMQAVLADKAALAIQNARRMKPGNGHIAIEGTARQFNLEVDLLATEVLVQLAAAGAATETSGASPAARAIVALNAAHPDLAPLEPLDEDLSTEDADPAPRP